MSLKITIKPEIQAFKKEGAGWLQFGIQGASTYVLLPIYNAYEGGVTFDSTEWTFDSTVITFDQTHFVVTELTAVKIDHNKKEVSRTVLPVSHITYNSDSRQFKTQTKLSYIERGLRKCTIVDLLRISNSLECSIKSLLKGLIKEEAQ